MHTQTHTILLYVIKNDGRKVAPTCVHNKRSAPELSELKEKTLNFASFVSLVMHKIAQTLLASLIHKRARVRAQILAGPKCNVRDSSACIYIQNNTTKKHNMHFGWPGLCSARAHSNECHTRTLLLFLRKVSALPSKKKYREIFKFRSSLSLYVNNNSLNLLCIQ